MLACLAARFAGPDTIHIFLVKRIAALMLHKASNISNRHHNQYTSHLDWIDAGHYPAQDLNSIHLIAVHRSLNIQDRPVLCSDHDMHSAL
jgi:hypothetical protein